MPLNVHKSKVLNYFPIPVVLRPKDIGGFYAPDTTMEPVFRKDKIVLSVHGEAARQGEFGLFVLHECSLGERRDMYFFVKKLVAIDGEYMILQQYNPDTLFRVKRSNITTAERVLEYHDLIVPERIHTANIP